MSRTVKIGSLKVGAKYPVRIKGMIKSPYHNRKKLVKEAKGLEAEGAEAVRVAVKEEKDARLAPFLKKHTSLPLVADVHFHHRLALGAIKEGFDGLRLNPANISNQREVREVVREAKKAKVSVRVGVNSGGFRRKFPSPKVLARAMVKRASDYIRIFEKEGFFDIIVSLKGSDVLATVIANELFVKRFDYPLHLGVTATGPFLEGLVKSSIGIGVLLKEGVGNTIRVSLTAPSFWEIRAAKYIIQSLGLRQFAPEVISCPTCSRCNVNLIGLVDKFKRKIEKVELDKFLRIAIMGCVVNGPGEAYQADLGVAFGKRKAAIFQKDNILRWSGGKRVVEDLISAVKEITHKREGKRGE